MTTAEAGTLAAAGYAIEFERLPGRQPGPTLVLLHEGLGRWHVAALPCSTQ